MALFKAVATEQLWLLQQFFPVLVMGSTFRALLAKRTNACGSDLSLGVVLTYLFPVLASLAAAMLLLAVRMAVNAVEAGAVMAARAAADGDKTFDADYEAAVAAVRGIGSVTAKWKRVSLRAMLLLAVILCAASSFLAVVTIKDGLRYMIRRDADQSWYDAFWTMGAFLVCSTSMVLMHGFSAWVALTQN